MPELRHNLMTGDWVILSTERAKRPDAHRRQMVPTQLPVRTADCPFCPGNELLAPDETARIDGENAGEWIVRAVPNRFPALAPEGEPGHQGMGYARSMVGVGQHEVLVESPLHNSTTALIPADGLYALLSLYRARMRAFYQDPRIEHVILFKNHGEAAGSSLEHPHSQIVGLPVVPGQVRTRTDQAQRHYDLLGRCLTCHCLEEEVAAGERIVEENEHFAAFIPYAALSPFHLWIVPKRHRAYFADIEEDELDSLSALLGRTTRRIYEGLDNPPFNYVVRSLSPREAESRSYHWYLSIVVRLSKSAGFELGTGMFINSGIPEESARFLRGIAVD